MKAEHDLTDPDGVIVAPLGIEIKADGITVTGCAMPCRT
jgi:hypothetical protein